jgi:hypothetical protein
MAIKEMYRHNLIMKSFISIGNAPLMQGAKRPANLITKSNIYWPGHHFLRKKACRRASAVPDAIGREPLFNGLLKALIKIFFDALTSFK